jgi:ribosomal protein L4
MIFLIEYDRALGKLVRLREFAADESATATSARLVLELEQMLSKDEREIVILEAESEEQLRKTHRRYFETISVLANPNSSLLSREAA